MPKAVTKREFHTLLRAEQKATLHALRALSNRVKTAGIGGERSESVSLGEFLETLIRRPYLMASPPRLVGAFATINKVAQFWAPRELPQRWKEAQLLPMYLELVKRHKSSERDSMPGWAS